MKVYRALPTLREARTFPEFLYTTARRAAVTKLRLRDEATRPDTRDNGAADCAFIAFDNAEAVHHALDRLPLAQREAVTLYFLEELSLEEIAGVLGVPLGTVKSRLHYGKQAIRNILSDGDGHVT